MFIFMSRVCFFLFIMKTNARATTAAVHGSDCGGASAAGWSSALGVITSPPERVLRARQSPGANCSRSVTFYPSAKA